MPEDQDQPVVARDATRELALRPSATAILRGMLAARDGGDVLDAIDRVGRAAIHVAAERSIRLHDSAPAAARAEAALGEVQALAARLDPPAPRALPFWRRAPRAAPAPLAGDAIEPQLAALIERLDAARDDITRAAIMLESDRTRLAEADDALVEAVHQLRALDQALAAAAREIGTTDPARAALLKGDAAARLLERMRDLLTQIVVTRQGRLSLDIVAQGQDLLAQALERTRHTVIAAVRTALAARRAVAQGQALAAQAAALGQVAQAAGDATDAAATRRALDDAVAQMRAAIDAVAARPSGADEASRSGF